MRQSPELKQAQAAPPVAVRQKSERREKSARPKSGRPRNGEKPAKTAPAPNSLPLWGELSILDEAATMRLRSAAQDLSKSDNAWLAAAGRYVGRSVDTVTGARLKISNSDLAGPKKSPANLWDNLAKQATSGPVGRDEALARVQVCTLYWLLAPGNLIDMHAFLDRWPGPERTMLSRSLARLGSVPDMYRLLAGFEVEGVLPPFGATAGILLSAARQIEVAEKPAETELRSIVIGGDVRLAPDLAGRVVDRGTESVLLDLQGVLSSADAAIVNLETVIANSGRLAAKQGKRPVFLHAPPMIADVLVEGGITCVTAANDHALDYGQDALAEQTALLENLGLAQAGAGTSQEVAEAPVYLDAKGLTVAIIAFQALAASTSSTHPEDGVFRLTLDDGVAEKLRPIIREARKKADLVLVSPHWGVKRQDAPGGAIRRLARELIDMGADAVTGHSAQVLQGIEVYQGKPIVYDMGALVADRLRSPEMSQSALFELRFDRAGVHQLVIHPATLSPGKTRLASGEAARVIFDRIVSMSDSLNEEIRWRYRDETLVLAFSPQREKGRKPTRKRGKAPEAKSRDRLRLFTKDLSETKPAMIRGKLPSKLLDTQGVDMGGGLVVLGQRRVRRAATGCGFLVEVIFRCPDPAKKSWLAALVAEPEDAAGEKFHYRHPVAEGMWISQTWKSEAAITDSFVVRPPADVRPGIYRLRWTLKEAGSGRIWPAEGGPSTVGWVELGGLEITDEAPTGVAGLDWDTRLPWRPLKPSDRSR